MRACVLTLVSLVLSVRSSFVFLSNAGHCTMSTFVVVRRTALITRSANNHSHMPSSYAPTIRSDHAHDSDTYRSTRPQLEWNVTVCHVEIHRAPLRMIIRIDMSRERWHVVVEDSGGSRLQEPVASNRIRFVVVAIGLQTSTVIIRRIAVDVAAGERPSFIIHFSIRMRFAHILLSCALVS